jgi:hypothetical protein
MSKQVFMFVAEGEVFMKFTLDTAINPAAEMWVAGLSSDPKVIPVETDSSVDVGWTYNGTDFTAPDA